MRTILMASLLLAALAAPAIAEDAPANLLAKFMQAWSAADAEGIAALFAPDADFVNPWGTKASGRDAIEMFYAAAFAHGYAGSRGVGEVVSTRPIAPDLVLIDGRWSIDGAKAEDGTMRPPLRGILTALVQKSAVGWQIVALRETNGAANYQAFPPPQ